MINTDIVNTISFIQEWINDSSRILYIPHSGNAGDAAIVTSAFQIFRRIDAPVVTADIEEISPGAVVIIGGGGNLVPYYSGVKNILQVCIKQNIKKCLLLPHSIHGHTDILATLDERFSILCRDKTSYAWVKNYAPRVNVALARDIVLEIDLEDLKQRTSTLRHKLALFLDFYWLKNFIRWRLAVARIKPEIDGTLKILRSDIESSDLNIANKKPERKIIKKYDLMRYNGVKTYSAATDQITLDVFKCIDKSERVITDRLHVSLIAALLGKPVCLLENSYGKLSGVWELALENGMNIAKAPIWKKSDKS